MKISIPTNRPARPRPCTPSVNLTNEAYDALYELSVKTNISMRQLASAIIIEARDNLEIVRGGANDA